MKRDEILLSAFVGLESAHFFSAMMPSLFTVRKFGGGDAMSVAALRTGLTLATIMALGLGLVIALLISNPMPIIFAAAMSAILVVIYQGAIAGILPRAA